MLPVKKDKFLDLAASVHRRVQRGEFGPFSALLGFAYDYPDIANPKGGITLGDIRSVKDAEQYLNAFFSDYYSAKATRVTLKACGTIADPAVDVVLQAFSGARREQCESISDNHRLSMAAENSIGELLEAYLASQLQPLGWVWCCGNVVLGIDFFKAGNPPVLLQVKNRSNSENSSSAKIRELVKRLGCPAPVKKWYRTNANSGKTRWDKFDQEPRLLGVATELGFQEFIRHYPEPAAVAKAGQR